MRITFAAIPAYGHVFPMAPLAAAAAAAGHEVTVAASELFAGRLPGRLVDGVPSGLTLQSCEREAAAEVRDRTDPLAWPTALFGIVMPRHVVPRLLHEWERTGPPDLVVHEGSNIGAAIAADRAGVPAVGFHIALAPPEVFLERLRTVADAPRGLLIDPTPPSWRGPDTADAVDRIPIRSTAWSDPGATQPAWLLEDRPGPTAYLTLGTVAFGAVDILRRSILATAARCSRLLVAAGPQADVAALGELPDTVHVEHYVDQATVLDHVDLAVHHGGSGTVLGCLAAGVPQVITPQGADQFLNAARLVELGLGHAVPNEAPPEAVGEAVERVLGDAHLHTCVRAVRDEIAAMPPPEDVVDTLVARVGLR